MIRQRLDPTLVGTLQHRWMVKKMNIKSEANWSVFRRDFTPGFKSMFEKGVNSGWYDVNKALEKYVDKLFQESRIYLLQPCLPMACNSVDSS
jgi:hypothetical protein